MQLKKQVDSLFRPLIGQRAWGVSIGLGSFVTMEFGPKGLYHHHYHGEWHLWLYMCEWKLNSNGRLLADSESKRKVMQLAVDNLNGAELSDVSFDSQGTVTNFIFDKKLRLSCSPYSDSAQDEEYWLLFMPDGKVASLKDSGLKYEPMDSAVASPARR